MPLTSAKDLSTSDKKFLNENFLIKYDSTLKANSGLMAFFKDLEDNSVFICKEIEGAPFLMHWQLRQRADLESDRDDLFAIINKYSKEATTQNYENYVHVALLDELSFDFSAETCSKTLERYVTAEESGRDKFFFIFEKIVHKIDSFSFVSNAESPKMVTYEDFNEIMNRISFDYNADHQHTETSAETIEVLLNFLHVILKQKFKDLDYQGTSLKAGMKSRSAGITNPHSLTWVG
jgi:hypothetical protein